MIAILILESPEECRFRLENYTEFKVSPEDKRLVLMNSWCLSGSNILYICGCSKSVRHRYLHKIICPSNIETDHIDLDPMNNRRDNLRPATKSQNNANTAVNQNNKLGLKGVRYKVNRPRPYEAYIRVNYQQIFLGCFDTPEEAHAAYYDAAKQYFGEFAHP